MTTLLLTGTTGFIGQRVLQQALDSPTIKRVVSIQRRTSTRTSDAPINEKLTEVVLTDESDWTDWPEHVLDQVKDVDTCVWLLGLTPGQGTKNELLNRKVSIDWPVYTLQQLLSIRQSASSSISKDPTRPPLRFVYISGGMAERNQDAKPIIMAEYLKTRGLGEVRVLELAKHNPTEVQTMVAKLGIVSDSGPLKFLVGYRAVADCFGLSSLVISLDDAAKSLLKLAVEGSEQDTWTNYQLNKLVAMASE